MIKCIICGKIKEGTRGWNKGPTCPSCYAKKKHTENPEKYRERCRIYYKNNTDKVKKQKREWYQEYKEEIVTKRAAYRENNPEKVKEINKKSYEKTKKLIKRRFLHSRGQAKSRGLLWDLTIEEYHALMNQNCIYCGSVISHCGVGLDRIDNSKGYSTDNVLPCCGSCNQMRNVHLTVEEMKVAMKSVLEYRKEQLKGLSHDK